MRNHIVALALAAFSLAGAALAQETRGRILGRVIDASGAVVPAVIVRATNTATNVTVSTQSNTEVADKFVGGWQLQGVYTGQGGAPINFGNVLFIGDVHDIPLPEGQRTVERAFNTAGFERNSANQLQFNYRTFPSRLNNVRADGTNMWDLSVLKNTRIGEKYNIQFRTEFLNAWNHPNFAGPNSSPTSSAFGQVTSQRGYPRRIQMMTKFIF